ncbi:hypothetical protein PG995_007224 [Apiospora arundinis]
MMGSITKEVESWKECYPGELPHTPPLQTPSKAYARERVRKCLLTDGIPPLVMLQHSDGHLNVRLRRIRHVILCPVMPFRVQIERAMEEGADEAIVNFQEPTDEGAPVQSWRRARAHGETTGHQRKLRVPAQTICGRA